MSAAVTAGAAGFCRFGAVRLLAAGADVCVAALCALAMMPALRKSASTALHLNMLTILLSLSVAMFGNAHSLVVLLSFRHQAMPNTDNLLLSLLLLL